MPWNQLALMRVSILIMFMVNIYYIYVEPDYYFYG